MPFSESQLETWSKQGSITQSAQTYKTINDVLESPDALYRDRRYDTFLQGSYGNQTNIFADSDVDIVIRLLSTFQHNAKDLSEDDRAAFNREMSDASYGYADFRRDVTAWLVKNYGQDVVPGSKAIFIKGNSTRRDADVLPAQHYRKYSRFKSTSDQSYVEGITFWTTAGVQIINYPKQHSANVTTKHQNTREWLKPSVRTWKNMRNRMIDKALIKEGLAPSYFIEGLLYNVPNDRFGGGHVANFVDIYNWLIQADRSKFVCANEQYYLCHPTSPVCWRAENCQAFLDALGAFWKNS